MRRSIRGAVFDIVMHDARVWGDRTRLKVAKAARMNNTLFNPSSGEIYVGEYSCAGHNVALITGQHEYNRWLEERMATVPRVGNDIQLGDGVWIGSGAIILGPCKVGDHAVIADGSVVRGDIPAYAIAAGVPARVIRLITPSGSVNSL